jgi:hypothetical protein
MLACADAKPSPASGGVRKLPERSQAPEPSAVGPVEPQAPVLLVTDPRALSAIEMDFGVLALGAPAAGLNNAQLALLPAYGSLLEPLEHDLRALTARDPQAGVSVRGHAHRTFDTRWLRAASAHFELIALANRMDRRALDRGGCGETRLIYRLAYREPEAASRLPLTVALEFRAGDDCKALAASWLSPPLQGPALAARLRAGPLAGLDRARLIQLAINVQAVRWPSAVRPDLGGHAEYLLRAFRWQQDRYLPRKLENTPDVARLRRDRALRAQLLGWLHEHRDEVDGGFALLPERFLAEVSTSVTPRGLGRLANRPFRQLFAPAEFADLPYAGMRIARSPEAFVRRLDDLSCAGCHQARSVAGFHQLGEDVGPPSANSLAVSHSPHVQEDLPRRGAYVLALASGVAPDEARPFAERALEEMGGYGAHCGLGDPGFASWTCAPGLHCDPFEAALGDDTVGACLADKLGTGDPCEPARVRPDADAHRDRVQRLAVRACPEVCEATRVGFPSGMCAGSCGSLGPEARCGGIAVLTPFNDCLAQGRPFGECASRHVRPAALRACALELPCRDDYLCAATQAGDGVCLPPYFVFQMRVDGHPASR